MDDDDNKTPLQLLAGASRMVLDTISAERDALRAEIKRIRTVQDVANEITKAVVDNMRRELSECRAQLQVFRDASEAAELRIVELRAERVELCVDIEQWKEDAADVEDLRAIIARAETLLAEGRKRNPERVAEGRCGTDDEFWTDALESALRGEP